MLDAAHMAGAVNICCLCANTNNSTSSPQQPSQRCWSALQASLRDHTLKQEWKGGGQTGQFYQARWPDEAHEMQTVHDSAAHDKADWCEDLVEGGLRQ